MTISVVFIGVSLTMKGGKKFFVVSRWFGGQVQGVATSHYDVPSLLLLFLEHVLFQGTEALQQPHLTDTVYQ
jgi:hypothetical protein